MNYIKGGSFENVMEKQKTVLGDANKFIVLGYVH